MTWIYISFFIQNYRIHDTQLDEYLEKLQEKFDE